VPARRRRDRGVVDRDRRALGLGDIGGRLCGIGRGLIHVRIARVIARCVRARGRGRTGLTAVRRHPFRIDRHRPRALPLQRSSLRRPPRPIDRGASPPHESVIFGWAGPGDTPLIRTNRTRRRSGPGPARERRTRGRTLWYRPHEEGPTAPMTIRTAPTRTSPVAPTRAAPEPLVVPPGTIAPGRARGIAPLRREGPSKLTGEAKYADDLVFPGAWYGVTIRS